MKTNETPAEGIACGIFQKEIEGLIRSGRLKLPFTFLDSMLHMSPARLASRLQETLDGKDRTRFLLVYGDCHPCLHKLGTSLTAGINCCEILLGKESYRELRRHGAFFLLPEWTGRWEEVFQRQLGLCGENAKTFMAEMHSSLIYLDTGILPVPHETLRKIGEFCGLPVTVMEVSLDRLLQAINSAARSGTAR